jgi:hypothetical protein
MQEWVMGAVQENSCMGSIVEDAPQYLRLGEAAAGRGWPSPTRRASSPPTSPPVDAGLAGRAAGEEVDKLNRHSRVLPCRAAVGWVGILRRRETPRNGSAGCRFLGDLPLARAQAGQTADFVSCLPNIPPLVEMVRSYWSDR